MKFCNFFKKKEVAVFIHSIVFTLIFNSSVLIQRFQDYKVAGTQKAISLMLFEIIMSVMFVFPFLYTLSTKSIFLRILFVLTYILSGIAAYFIYTLNITINHEIIASFFEASKEELTNFINLNIASAMLFSTFLAALCLKHIDISFVEEVRNKKLTFITAIFTLGCIIGDGDWANNIMPYNIYNQSSIYLIEKTSIAKPRLNLAKSFNYEISTRDDNLNVILILGESSRGDHYSLSGYSRETSPLMKNEKNLIYFPHVTACYPLTRVAVPCMLTRATRADRSASKSETSFIGIFKSLGFYTSWFGMQGTYTVIDSPYMDLAKEADKSLLIGIDVDVFSTIDDRLYPFVDNYFVEHPKGNNLLILHTIGSHFHYEDRYTDEYRQFTPICTKKKFMTDMTHCTLEERINSYDNSTLYTDNFIKSIIDKVRDKNAIVIFTPDHAESLGENGRFLHGTHNADEQVAVNMMIWTSDEFIKKYPDIIQTLNSKKNTPILHDHLFHSILGCSGIKSNVIDPNLNLCSNEKSN